MLTAFESFSENANFEDKMMSTPANRDSEAAEAAGESRKVGAAHPAKLECFVTRSILYCGDTDQNGAAAYLSGLMASWKWKFEYLPSHVPMSVSVLQSSHSLLILSDYPASLFDDECQRAALQKIEQGCGLLMIGGWESFHGHGGNWDGTLLGSVLPVQIASSDDRMNFDQSAFLVPVGDHEVTSGLPWRWRPPAIGGMNRVIARPSATVLLKAQSVSVSVNDLAGDDAGSASELLFSPAEVFPALVVGQCGQGRTAAFLSDVAPHWVGGFVDWGSERVTGQAVNAGAIEVGSDYAQFWKQLLQWCME